VTGPRFIIGERLSLRRIEERDLEHVRRWMDDEEFRTLIGANSPMTESDAEEWFRRISREDSRAWYVIVLDEGDRVIGEAGLLRMFPPWRTTDMSIVIGEPGERGKGYGSEVGRLLLDYAFNYVGMHRVAIGVVGFNDGALRFWKRLGFQEEGVQKDGYLHDGRFHDFVMMSMLEDDWRARHDGEGAG
jgi:diamine N-acetyltransferase